MKKIVRTQKKKLQMIKKHKRPQDDDDAPNDSDPIESSK